MEFFAWVGGIAATLGLVGTVLKLALGPWWRVTWASPSHEGLVLVTVQNRSHLLGRDVTMFVRRHDSREWSTVEHEDEIGFGQSIQCFMSLVRDDTPYVFDLAGIVVPPKGVPKERKLYVRLTWNQLPFLPIQWSRSWSQRMRPTDFSWLGR